MHHLYIFMHFTSTWTMQSIFSPSSSSLSSFFQFLLLFFFFFNICYVQNCLPSYYQETIQYPLNRTRLSSTRTLLFGSQRKNSRVKKKKKRRRLKTRRIVSFTYDLQSSSIFLQKFEDSRSLSTRVHSRRNANIIHIIIL